MINILHDFENIDKHIDQRPTNDVEELVWNAFFPQIQMTFSQKENPMEIVNAIDKNLKMLKVELLLLQQNTSAFEQSK